MNAVQSAGVMAAVAVAAGFGTGAAAIEREGMATSLSYGIMATSLLGGATGVAVLSERVAPKRGGQAAAMLGATVLFAGGAALGGLVTAPRS